MEKRLGDLAAENESLMAELKSLRASVDAQPRSPSKDVDIDHFKALEARVIALEQEKEGLVGDKEKLNAEIDALNATGKEFADKVARKAVEAEELAIAKSAMARDVAAMNKLIKEKDATESELREKLKTLSEKTRDVMKKYSESKERLKILEKCELEAKKAKSELSLKEGETLSLKLKLDNLERIVEDQKEDAASSADLKKKTKEARHADQEMIKSLRSNVKKLETELERAVNATAGLASEAALAQKALNEEKLSRETLQTKLNEAHSAYEQSARTTASSYEEELSSLRSDNENLKVRLEEEAKAAERHEDYKKRAQAALKKANMSSSTVAEEVDDLRKQVQARDKEIEALQATSREEILAREREQERAIVQEQECKQVLAEMENLRIDKSEELTTAHALIEALRGEVQAARLRVSEEEAKVTGLQVERDALQKEKVELASQLQQAPQNLQQASVSTASAPSPLQNGIGQEKQESVLEVPRAPLAVDESTYVEDTSGVPGRPTSPDQLFYVQELMGKIDELKRESSERNMEVNEAKTQILQHLEDKSKLNDRIEELETFLNRSKKSVDQDAVTNMEYLKALIFRFMATREVSEKKRLFPVIATILNLTSAERGKVEMAIAELESDAALGDVVNQSITTITNLFA